jgi:two-component system cell cycle response regulator
MSTRLLIIEDNPANLELMAYLLTAFGYGVIESRDGLAGVDAAQQHVPDLILCDVQLPKLDGYSVVQRLKNDAQLARIPVVAVTAFAMVGDRDKVLAAGFDGYIAKPIAPETFVSQVEEFLLPPQRHGRPLPSAHTTPTAAAKPTAGASAQATILVVDDLVTNIELARSTFEPCGYRVEPAMSVREALATARRVRPDIIVSDVQMPEGTGYELLAAVKNDPALKSIPVVFLASTPQGPHRRAAALAAGAAKFILRPIAPQTLLAEIADCLRTYTSREHGHHSNRGR